MNNYPDGYDAVWNEDFKCFVYHVGYILDGKIGAVSMKEGGCTDMSGAIRYFKRIDKEVQTIITHYGNPAEPDTCYYREGDDWVAQRSDLPRYRSEVH